MAPFDRQASGLYYADPTSFILLTSQIKSRGGPVTRFSRIVLLAAFLALQIALLRAQEPAGDLVDLAAHQQDA